MRPPELGPISRGQIFGPLRHGLAIGGLAALLAAMIALYSVGGTDIETGDIVIAWPPAAARDFVARRHYLPANVPLVKRVAAEPGDTICALGQEIFVNGRWVAERLVHEGAGRPMPWWTGCVTLRNGAMFLLMADTRRCSSHDPRSRIRPGTRN